MELVLAEKDPGLRVVEFESAYEMSSPYWGPVWTHTQYFVELGDIMSRVMDNVYDERSIPVTFCSKFVRRLPLEHQGTNTVLQ